MQNRDTIPFYSRTMPKNQNNVRDSILDASDRLLARSGYKRMKVEDIAREAGIGKGSVYLHFESKEELALAHLDRLIVNIREHLKQVFESSAPASKRLNMLMIDRVMLRFDNVQNFTQSLNELIATARPSIVKRRKKQVDVEAEMIAALIADGQKSGEFGAGDTKQLSKTLVDATDSLLPYSLSAFEKKTRREVKRRAVAVTELLIDGLRYRRQ